MIRIKETATEGGSIVYRVEFDDLSGQPREVVVSVRAEEWSEGLARERIKQAVERERARLMLETARALEGMVLEEVS